MTPTTCSLCGSPLPAVAADQRHPDWCPTCAARATGDLGPAPVTTASVANAARPSNAWSDAVSPGTQGLLLLAPAPGRYLEGAVVGVATATLAGLIWWAVSALTGVQFAYFAALLGLVVGNGVLIGSRRGGGIPALLAVVSVLVSLAVAQYFIERSIAISDHGADIPLWHGFAFARTVVTERLKDQPLIGLSWLMAAVVALVSTMSPKRRAVL
ncbi:MAG: zinc finger domain-containing protein [Acidimicrobiales bacterium]|nr:hypothetical protein [Actinomycetota bacterium]